MAVFVDSETEWAYFEKKNKISPDLGNFLLNYKVNSACFCWFWVHSYDFSGK